MGYNWHNDVVPEREVNARISRKGSLSTKGPNGCERSCRWILRKAYANDRKTNAQCNVSNCSRNEVSRWKGARMLRKVLDDNSEARRRSCGKTLRIEYII